MLPVVPWVLKSPRFAQEQGKFDGRWNKVLYMWNYLPISKLIFLLIFSILLSMNLVCFSGLQEHTHQNNHTVS